MICQRCGEDKGPLNFRRNDRVCSYCRSATARDKTKRLCVDCKGRFSKIEYDDIARRCVPCRVKYVQQRKEDEAFKRREAEVKVERRVIATNVVEETISMSEVDRILRRHRDEAQGVA